MSVCLFVHFPFDRTNSRMSLIERLSQNKENATMGLEDRDAGAPYQYWHIGDNDLDSLNRIPLHVRFTPPVIFDSNHQVLEIRDTEWLKFVEKKAELCAREGDAIWEHYQKDTKQEEDKRLHYHAIIVSTEEALEKWFQRQKYGGKNIKSIVKTVDPTKNYTLVKCFRYVCKDGRFVVTRNYSVDRLRNEYWMIDAEVTAYKESTKKQKKRKFDSWTDEVYANISHSSTTQAGVGVEIMNYYLKKGKLLPQPYVMGQMTATFVAKNNALAEVPMSDLELFRRLYPNLA